MSNFREIFSSQHVILPVVHVESEIQAETNTKIAKECGADGVFLINMSGRGSERLIQIYQHVRNNNPDFWIGLNCLDLSALGVFAKIPKSVNGVWVDNAYIEENQKEQRTAEMINRARKRSGWEGLYFGGVAFKYQKPVIDLAKVAQIATTYMDVVTTSGAGTGQEPNFDKIITMKKAIGNTPLAIASGISPKNIRYYLDYADCFLVATSLLKPDTNDFDPYLLESLIKAVR